MARKYEHQREVRVSPLRPLPLCAAPHALLRQRAARRLRRCAARRAHHVVAHLEVGDHDSLADLAQRGGVLEQRKVHAARHRGQEVDRVQRQVVLRGRGGREGGREKGMEQTRADGRGEGMSAGAGTAAAIPQGATGWGVLVASSQKACCALQCVNALSPRRLPVPRPPGPPATYCPPHPAPPRPGAPGRAAG